MINRLYTKMLRVRRFEERLLELFAEGAISGTTHCCIGQEANAVGVIEHLDERDVIFSNHRCHGHYLVRTEDVTGLLAELMGKEGGLCAGRGGSQHLCAKNFFTNGVQGSIVPVAAGMALAEKVKGTGAIVTVFIGDGTWGQGAVYETLNMASLWELPYLVVVENNRYAQSTPIERNFAGSFVERARSFSIDAGEIESFDALEIYNHFGEIVERVRAECRPHVETIHTYRFCPHSKNDDHRPKDEVASWMQKDPLSMIEAQVDDRRRLEAERRIRGEIDRALRKVRDMPVQSLRVT